MDRSKLFATCNTPSSLSHSSQDRFSVSFTSWSSLLWTHSSTFFKWGAQSWAHWFCLIVIKKWAQMSLTCLWHPLSNQFLMAGIPACESSCCWVMSSFSQSGSTRPSLTQPVGSVENGAPPSVCCVTVLRRTLVPEFNCVCNPCVLSLCTALTVYFFQKDPARGGQQGPWPWGSVVGCSFGIPSSELFYRPQTLCS